MNLLALASEGLALPCITVLPTFQPPYYTETVFDFLLDILFPRRCLGCGKIDRYLCPNCQKTVRFYSPLIAPNYPKTPYIDGLYVLAHYDGIIRRAVRDIKYRGRYAILTELASLILQKYHYKFCFDYLVPVPLSKERLKSRGFNQAEVLAKNLKLAPVLNCLTRIRDTRPQFDLKLTQRRQNVKDAFAISHKLRATSYCLVDDVCTTGSTLSECAKVLKTAGASKVYAVCIARGN